MVRSLGSRICHFSLVAAFLFCAVARDGRAGTKIRIATQIGNVDLELYDQDKPITVANFLHYLNTGRYAGTFLHRLISGFIVQGGGYGLNSSNVPTHIDTYAAIQNEYAIGPTYSNTIGTIAMAKVPATDDNNDPIPGGGPDSATSEWFINLGDNAANLDAQNGGFTVFGHVIAGMDVLTRFNTTFADSNTAVDAVVNFSASLSNLPLATFSSSAGVRIQDLLFTTITVLKDPVAAVAPEITVKGTIKTKLGSVKIKGTAATSVTQIEWRMGTKGAFHKRAAGTSWNLKVGGLKKGTSFVFVRGLDASGTAGSLRKIKVIRK